MVAMEITIKISSMINNMCHREVGVEVEAIVGEEEEDIMKTISKEDMVTKMMTDSGKKTPLMISGKCQVNLVREETRKKEAGKNTKDKMHLIKDRIKFKQKSNKSRIAKAQHHKTLNKKNKKTLKSKLPQENSNTKNSRHYQALNSWLYLIKALKYIPLTVLTRTKLNSS